MGAAAESTSGATDNPAYDAASVTGSRKCWTPHLYSPNDAVVQGYTHVLARSRDAFRNNPWISQAVNVLTSSEVGDGIRAKNVCEDEDYRVRWQELWDEWSESCDISGVAGINQILDQCVTERIVAGGAFIRFIRPRFRQGQSRIPLRLQTLSTEQVPMWAVQPDNRKNKTICGIEFTPEGVLRGYHVYLDHPGEVSGLSFGGWRRSSETVFIPARDMSQHFIPHRIGQVREAPTLAAALDRARASVDYDRHELDRKKNKSMFTGTLERDHYTDEDYNFDPITGAPISDDSYVPEVAIRAGMMLNLLPGEKANFFNADNTSDGFDNYVNYQNLALSAACHVPYEMVTGDYSNINDRVVRSILDQFRRDINKNQRLYTIPQITRRVASEFTNALQLSGLLSRPDFFQRRSHYLNVIYTPQPFPYVHPTQDRQGIKLDLEMGLSNRTRECQKRRIDREVLDAETEAERRDEEAKGLNFDFRYTDFENQNSQNSGEPDNE